MQEMQEEFANNASARAFQSGIQILSLLAGGEQLRLPAAAPPISQFVIKFR
jgi:hypothetical protein